MDMRNTQNAYVPLAWSLFLFTISGLIGLVPLVFAVILWHLSLSAGKEAIAEKIRPWVMGLVIVGYVILLALIVYIVLNRQIFLGT